MKKFNLVYGIIIVVVILSLSGCFGPDEKEAKSYSPEYFILCEGNFQQSNSSLWGVNGDLDSLTGPIYLDSQNPLGDVGQDIATKDGKLFVVMNNSHSLEVMDVSLENSLSFEISIDLSGMSPRYIAFDDNNAFITSWAINGILVVDLTTSEVKDTILLNGKFEDLVQKDGKLYVALNMNSAWVTENKILEITLSPTPTVTDTFEVIPGPTTMFLDGDNLFVASVYYGVGWAKFCGTSKINLSVGNVITKDHGQGATSDIIKVNGQIYQNFNNKILAVNSDLSLDNSNQLGEFSNIYSVWSDGEFVFVGETDYIAPDTVTVLKASGEVENTFVVGALPGAYCKK
ncbi:MAG: hypothetical protein U9N76_03330 [Candidatus Marinimicrobia bacterium]|nr:hypothetical protein [Candidatus Neomarinimicrobiota bacterium]